MMALTPRKRKEDDARKRKKLKIHHTHTHGAGGISKATLEEEINKLVTGVSSVYTRDGDVVAAADDYKASEVTNDSGVVGSYVKQALDTLKSLIDAISVSVSSVFGRTGDVVATLSDYDASQVDNDSLVAGDFVDEALNQLDTDIGALLTGVSSVFTRTGHVLAVASDYDASQVDNDSTVPGAFVDDALDNLIGANVTTKEPTGFPNRTDSIVSYNDGTRTVAIAPVAASFDYWIKGTLYTKSATQSRIIADTEGTHYIYFDGATLTSTTTLSESLFTDMVIVTAVYWDKTNGSFIYRPEERHGLLMPGMTHYYLHTTKGTQYISGLALGNFTIDDTGADDEDAQFSCADGVIFDEDISHTITDGSPQDISPILNAPVYYKTGAAGDWRSDTTDITFPVIRSLTGSLRLAYNQFTGGAWQQTEVANAQYVLAHIYATNDTIYPIIAVQGEVNYASIATARAGAATEIESIFTAGLPFAEFVAIGTVIYQTSVAYGNTVKARIRSTDVGDNYVDWRD